VAMDADILMSDPNFKITCPQLDFLFALETGRLTRHSKRNQKIQQAVDVVLSVLVEAAATGAAGAGAAFGGPMGAKAAGAMAGVLGNFAKDLIMGGIKYDNAITEFRRQVRQAWMGAYQSGIVNDKGGYVSTDECTAIAKHMMQLTKWFLHLSAEEWKGIQYVVNSCTTESENTVNTFDKYEVLLNVMGRKIEKSFAGTSLQETLDDLMKSYGETVANLAEGTNEVIRDIINDKAKEESSQSDDDDTKKAKVKKPSTNTKREKRL